MRKKKQGKLNVKLDPYEKEIEDALPESLEEISSVENLAADLRASSAASLLIL